MKLDIVIDVVCPWCYVGKKQLDKALTLRPSVVSEKRWRPYQLAPETPAEGVDRRAYYKQKFGEGSPQLTAMREHLLKTGAALGIKFDFESDCKVANTLDAHRLIRWAYSVGAQDMVAEDLMQRYFEDCAFLGDPELLADVADRAGMDKALVEDLLSSDEDKKQVYNEVMQARQMGIQGVPMFIFDDKNGVSGAQDASVLVEVMDKLSAA
ncbi:MAG: DsbA family oxidoreductase [Kordiimonas sp.]